MTPTPLEVALLSAAGSSVLTAIVQKIYAKHTNGHGTAAAATLEAERHVTLKEAIKEAHAEHMAQLVPINASMQQAAAAMKSCADGLERVLAELEEHRGEARPAIDQIAKTADAVEALRQDVAQNACPLKGQPTVAVRVPRGGKARG